MEIKDIIAELERVSRKFSYDAIVEAIHRKDEIIPELLTLIDDPARLFKICKQRPNYMGHIYAFFLLAQFRVTKALAPLLKIYRYPSDQVNLLGWDFITGDLARVVASVYDGNLAPLQRMVEDQEVDEYVQEAMLKALFILVTYNKMPREQLIDYCEALLREKLERSPSAVWFGLVNLCTELADKRLIGDIETAYADGLVDPSDIALEDVQEGMARGWEENLRRSMEELEYGLVEDVAREMEWWAYFQEERHQKRDKGESRDFAPPWGLPDPGSPRHSPLQSQRNQPVPHKTGRNQPCPCGSGKKYKNCCGKKTSRKENV